MKKRKQISPDEAKRIGDSLYFDWDQVDLEKFRQSLMGNHKQAARDPEKGVIYERCIVSERSSWLICRNSRIISPAWKH